MAVGDNINVMITGTDATLGTAITNLDTAVQTLRNNGAVVYAGKITLNQSGIFSNVVAATGLPSGYIAWAMVQYLSAV